MTSFFILNLFLSYPRKVKKIVNKIKSFFYNHLLKEKEY